MCGRVRQRAAKARVTVGSLILRFCENDACGWAPLQAYWLKLVVGGQKELRVRVHLKMVGRDSHQTPTSDCVACGRQVQSRLPYIVFRTKQLHHASTPRCERQSNPVALSALPQEHLSVPARIVSHHVKVIKVIKIPERKKNLPAHTVQNLPSNGQ